MGIYWKKVVEGVAEGIAPMTTGPTISVKIVEIAHCETGRFPDSIPISTVASRGGGGDGTLHTYTSEPWSIAWFDLNICGTVPTEAEIHL